MRKHPLVNESLYRIFTKSISGYRVFRSTKDYYRMIETIKFYRYIKPPTKFSTYLTLKNKDEFFQKYMSDRDYAIEIIAYCLMPTHIHFVLKPN